MPPSESCRCRSTARPEANAVPAKRPGTQHAEERCTALSAPHCTAQCTQLWQCLTPTGRRPGDRPNRAKPTGRAGRAARCSGAPWPGRAEQGRAGPHSKKGRGEEAACIRTPANQQPRSRTLSPMLTRAQAAQAARRAHSPAQPRAARGPGFAHRVSYRAPPRHGPGPCAPAPSHGRLDPKPIRGPSPARPGRGGVSSEGVALGKEREGAGGGLPDLHDAETTYTSTPGEPESSAK